jgi:diadenosine tetraphosphatase ApaH/serine/threonine PP2A family protein phosphatase
MTRDDYDYLSSCPVILHLPTFNNSVIVHGGIDPTIQNLYDQIPYLVMNMRNIDKHDNPTPDHTVGQQWAASFNDVQKELTVNNTNVYYGHNADRGLNLRDYTFGLDTGCVYGKELTAMDIRTHQLTQVKCKKYAS